MSWERLVKSTLFQEFVKKTPSTDEYLSELRGIVARVIGDAETLLPRYSETHPEYTLHDSVHSVKVIELMGLIIPKDTLEKLNSLELAMLILAAYLHDIGMVVSREEREKTLKSEEFSRLKEDFPDVTASLQKAAAEGENRIMVQLEDYLLSMYFRKGHSVRSRDFVTSRYGGEKGLVHRGVNFADDVALLCESHCLPARSLAETIEREGTLIETFRRDKSIHDLHINLQYLAVCLRLADLMDFDRERTPDILFKFVKPRSEVSIEEWNKHLSVTGWKIGPDEIRYEATCTHPLYQHVLFEFLDRLDDELFQCTYIIRDNRTEISEKYKLPLPTRVDRRYIESKDYIYGPFQFSLDFDRIIDMLLGERLYSTSSIRESSSVAIRELLQNAIDACRHRKAIEKALGQRDYRPLISFTDSIDEDGKPTLIVEDNGVGIDKHVLEDFFMKIGKSYYRSKEFERERAEFKRLGCDFEAAAQFGIGVMSYFMIADHIEIMSLKKTLKGTIEKALFVDIEGPSRFFVVRPCERKDVGTKLVLHLKKEIPWKDWLREYAVHVEIPLTISGRRLYGSSKFDPELYKGREARSTSLTVGFLMEKYPHWVYDVDLSRDPVATQHGLRGKIHIHFLEDTNGLPCFSNEYLTIKGNYIQLRHPRDSWKRDYKAHQHKQIQIDRLRAKLSSKEPSAEEILELGKLESLDLRMSIGLPPRGVYLSGGLMSCDGIYISSSEELDLDIPHNYDIDMSGTLRPDVNVTKDDFVHNQKMHEFRSRVKEIIAGHMLADIKGNRFFPKSFSLTEFLKHMHDSADKELSDLLIHNEDLINEILVYNPICGRKSILVSLSEIVRKYHGVVLAFLPSARFKDSQTRKLHSKLIVKDDSFPNSLLFDIGKLTVHTSKEIDRSFLEVKLRPVETFPRQRMRLARYEGYHASALYVKNLACAFNMDHDLIRVYFALKSRNAEPSILKNLETLFGRVEHLPRHVVSNQFDVDFANLKREINRLKRAISRTRLLDKKELHKLKISRKDIGLA